MKRYYLRTWVKVALLIIAFTVLFSLIKEPLPAKANTQYSLPMPSLRKQIDMPEIHPVRFTSFWPGDGTGSGSKTASGLSVEDFELDEQGRYTYKGMLVIGTATEECLNSRQGACARYTNLPEGYIAYKLYDELTINLNGTDYQGIVLDHCGACMRTNGEAVQRIDIMVRSKQDVIDTTGFVYQEESK